MNELSTNEPLTAREEEVLRYMSFGASFKMLASVLKVSVFTVGNHMRNIYRKLNVNSATEAAAWFFMTTYNIPATDNPLKVLGKGVVGVGLLLAMMPGILNGISDDDIRMYDTKKLSKANIKRFVRLKRRDTIKLMIA